TLDTTPFVQFASLGLDPTQPNQPGGSDSPQDPSAVPLGPTATDRITNVTMPFIQGIVDQAAPVQVEIFDLMTNAVLGTGTSRDTGTFSVKTSGLGADGLKTLGVRALSGPRVSNVAQFQFTLDTTAAAPPTLSMTAASDSGVSNSDHNTKVTTPTFTGVGE